MFNRCPFLIKISASNKHLPAKNFQIFFSIVCCLAEKLDLVYSWKRKERSWTTNYDDNWIKTRRQKKEKKFRRKFETAFRFDSLLRKIDFSTYTLNVLLETCKFPKCEENFNTAPFKSQTCRKRCNNYDGKWSIRIEGEGEGWIVAEAEREDRRRWARAAIHDLSNYPECRHNLSHGAPSPPPPSIKTLNSCERKSEREKTAESGEKDFQKGDEIVSSFLPTWKNNPREI